MIFPTTLPTCPCATTLRRLTAASGGASPVAGQHDHLGAFPDVAVDVIHRMVTDPARLSRTWFQETMDAGLAVEPSDRPPNPPSACRTRLQAQAYC